MPGFNLGQTFFGFKPEHRGVLHENLWNLLWWGEGRWDWDTLYNLHIPLRTFWFRKMNEILEIKNAPKNTPPKSSKPKIDKPPF